MFVCQVYLHNLRAYHRCSASFSTAMDVQIDGNRTKLHDLHPRDDNNRQVRRKTTCQQVCKSSMANVSLQRPEPAKNLQELTSFLTYTLEIDRK